jgi:hypothetical protein
VQVMAHVHMCEMCDLSRSWSEHMGCLMLPLAARGAVIEWVFEAVCIRLSDRPLGVALHQAHALAAYAEG